MENVRLYSSRSQKNMMYFNNFFPIVKTLTINFLIFFFLVVLAIGIIILEARHSNRLTSEYKAPYTMSDCKKSPHYQVSLEEALILGEDEKLLERYCLSSVDIAAQPGSKIMTYWDYHYYSVSPMHSELINFKNSDYFNSRNVPCSEACADGSCAQVVWLFGGSTMQNMETSDEYSIANTFCNELSKQDKYKVLNLGVGSFFSELETVKLINLGKLSLLDEENRPNIVVFYDGYNDSERISINGRWTGLPGNLSQVMSSHYHSNLTCLFLKKINRNIKRLTQEKQNVINDMLTLAADNTCGKDNLANHKLSQEVPATTEKDGLLLSSQAFLYDQKVLSGVCTSLNLRCYVVLQPMLPLRMQPVGSVEAKNYELFERNGMAALIRRFYKEVSKNAPVLNAENYCFIDLSMLPNEDKYKDFPFFYDEGHTGFFAGRIIGEELARRISNSSPK